MAVKRVDLEDDDDLDGAVAEEEVDSVEEDEEDAEPVKPKAKKKPARVVEEDEEEEEAPAPRKHKQVAAGKSGKEKTKVKNAKSGNKPKIVRARRTGDRPFLDGSIIGRAFKLAERGISLKKLKQFVTDQKAQPWVISFLRKGDRNGFTWRVEEEKGMFRISGLRKPKTLAKAA